MRALAFAKISHVMVSRRHKRLPAGECVYEAFWSYLTAFDSNVLESDSETVERALEKTTVLGLELVRDLGVPPSFVPVAVAETPDSAWLLAPLERECTELAVKEYLDRLTVDELVAPNGPDCASLLAPALLLRGAALPSRPLLPLSFLTFIFVLAPLACGSTTPLLNWHALDLQRKQKMKFQDLSSTEGQLTLLAPSRRTLTFRPWSSSSYFCSCLPSCSCCSIAPSPSLQGDSSSYPLGGRQGWRQERSSLENVNSND